MLEIVKAKKNLINTSVITSEVMPVTSAVVSQVLSKMFRIKINNNKKPTPKPTTNNKRTDVYNIIKNLSKWSHTALF